MKRNRIPVEDIARSETVLALEKTSWCSCPCHKGGMCGVMACSCGFPGWRVPSSLVEEVSTNPVLKRHYRL